MRSIFKEGVEPWESMLFNGRFKLKTWVWARSALILLMPMAQKKVMNSPLPIGLLKRFTCLSLQVVEPECQNIFQTSFLRLLQMQPLSHRWSILEIILYKELNLPCVMLVLRYGSNL